MEGRRYSDLMGEWPAHLRLKLDTAEPVELGDFVGAFTSLANEFERYVEEAYPGVRADPRMYVREVRSGCIEADMITGLVIAGGVVLQNMDQILILEDFVKRWGKRLTALITGRVPSGQLNTPEELKDFYNAVRSISSDPVASHNLEAAIFEDGRRDIRAGFKFTTPDARAAEQTIEDQQKLIGKKSTTAHARVLMRYTRTDVHDAGLNKRSGERVVIESVSPLDRPVMYSSEIAEREIREQIREADENVYKRGFVVDVVAQEARGKLAAYAVTDFHSVIDLD